jgi:hypothetical protein
MAVLLTAEGPPLPLRRSQPNGAAPGGVLNRDIQEGLALEGPLLMCNGLLANLTRRASWSAC